MSLTNPSSGPGGGVAISELEYEQFCELFYRTTGIRFGAHKRYFVDKRIVDRINATGKKSFADYMRSLRADPHGVEMQFLVDSMTVNETYFYREHEYLDLLASALLPRVTDGRPRGKEVKVWSMPCSSGEEPYSIALKLLEDWDDVDNYDVSIFGSDIDSKVIERSRAGLYSDRSVHKLPASVKKKYFTREGSTGWRIIEELRESVDFRKCNATDRTQMMRYQQMDVIFCRNMLIYFDDVSRRKCIDAFYDALRPGGFLVLGASESIGQTSRLFEAERVRGLVVYRRPAQGGR